MTPLPIVFTHSLIIRARSINGARAERNEFLLLHTFNKMDYICPDKTDRWKKNANIESIGKL